MERIGLIAGGGEIPVIFAREARKKGVKVIGFAVKGLASPELEGVCSKVHWLGTNQIMKGLLLFAVERIRRIVMLGKIDKSIIYDTVKKDEGELARFKETPDKSDYSILDRVTAELKKRGVEVIDSLEYLSGLLPSKGVLAKRHLSAKEKEDVSFGFKIAKEIAQFDIGQTIVIKDKSVIAVEAVEGTDRTIKRAAELGVKEFTVVKVSRPKQDMRWDVPVVGPETLKLIADNGGKVLALEEKRMFLVDKDSCARLADKNDISIVVV